MASESNKAQPRAKWFKYLRLGILGFMGFVTLVILISVILVVNDLPPMNDIENPQLDISTQIYSADGKKMGSMHDGQDRDYMAMDSMSHWVKDALLATEDVRFYEHSGIDPRTPFTILKDLIFSFRLRGGSTISQQLARNLYNQVGRENSVSRKAKEAIVAIILESRFTKDELLTNIMIYWATQTGPSSVRIYYENRVAPPNPAKVTVPTACAQFPKEISAPPRKYLEARYNLTRYTLMPRGGHFAAMEQPDLLVSDVRTFFRDLRR